jgi:hypothetical protein
MNKNDLQLRRETIRSLSGKRTQMQTGIQQLGTPDMRDVNGGIFWSVSLCGGPSKEIGESIGGVLSGVASGVASAVGSAVGSALSSAVGSAVSSAAVDTPLPISEAASGAASAVGSAGASAVASGGSGAVSGWNVSQAVSGFLSGIFE